MKVRVTLLTENNSPVEALGENPENRIKGAWELMLTMFMCYGKSMGVDDNGDKVTVEKVEVVRDE